MPNLVHVNPERPDGAVVRAAAEILRRGGLVAIPTETVYGLAAHALDAAAVAKIFAAKGRPSNNPLIVHVADVGAARALASSWPVAADALAARFWPGPLTVVVPRAAHVPDVVTASGPTVAIRIPAHPVALAILREAGIPLAAPSANPSNAISPTTARHVADGLGDRVDLIVDGGPCAGGLESTVVHLGSDPPTLLRPGLVTVAELEAAIGPVRRTAATGEVLASPGMLAKHYAPRAALEVARDDRARVAELATAGERVAWLAFDASSIPDGDVIAVTMPVDPPAYSARLYASLHEADARGATRIVVAEPPDDDAWLAVRDRLRRAATA